MTAPSIDARIRDFQHDLPRRTAIELVQRHITQGSCFALSDEAYFDLRHAVASHFSLHISQVVVVGSAKLGFSVVRSKLFRPFSDRSDIDVALSSSELYDAFWKDVFDYWARGERWYGLDDFRKYHFRGWLRPDKLPTSPSFARSQEWWDFFRSLAASRRYGPYKLTGALYKSWHYLERYQEVCFASCQQDASGEV